MARSASALAAAPAPALDARTKADLAAAGGCWTSPLRRDAFVADALARRSDPVFRLLEEVAEARLRVVRLVELGSDRLDFHEVHGPSLADALRAAFEAGAAYGRRSALGGPRTD